MKLDILAFGAHPDDAELGAGGSLSKAVATGSKVGIIDLTRGELGTRGTPELRSQEAHKAAKIIGVSIRENLGFTDGFFENSKVVSVKQASRVKLIEAFSGIWGSLLPQYFTSAILLGVFHVTLPPVTFARHMVQPPVP